MNAGNIISAVFGAVIKVFCAMVVIFLLYQGATSCYDYGYRIFMEPPISSEGGREVMVEVKKGLSPLEIGKIFESKGLVRDAKLFAMQYMLSEYRKDVKSGEFELSTAMTAEEMMKVMATPVEETSQKDTEE